MVNYLQTALIFGICGACRREELAKVTIDNIQDKNDVLLVKIPITKTYKPRSFVITDEFYTIYKKYMALRPANIETSRFFLNYQNGKCTQQPIEINKFGKMPSTIASYLGLSDPSSYTGHTFRRTSATILADSGANIITLKQHGGWKSSTVAEGYIDDSFNNKKISHQIINSIIDTQSTSTSQTHLTVNRPSTSKTYIEENKENVTTSNTSEAKNISLTFNNCPDIKIFFQENEKT